MISKLPLIYLSVRRSLAAAYWIKLNARFFKRKQGCDKVLSRFLTDVLFCESYDEVKRWLILEVRVVLT
jgi:hypothetical protein